MSTKKKLMLSGIVCVILAVLLTIICLPAVFAKDEDKFVYELQNDCYIIKDIKNDYRDGWFGRKKLVVPATYKNKKVVKLEKIEANCLRELVISEGIETISDNALSYNARMSKVTLPDSLKYLGAYSFANTQISSITIPQSVTSIGEGALRGCNRLKNMTVANDNPVYHSSGNCIIETASKTLVFGCAVSTIPSDGSVTSISSYAFFGYTDLENITIPDSITSIGSSAFSNTKYYNDEKNNWQHGVLYIGKHLIKSKTNNTGSYEIKQGTLIISDSAFLDCSGLTSVSIPDSVTSIGNSAFSDCSNLTEINFSGTIAQWKAVKKGNDWNKSTGNYTVHCTDGDLSKSES